MVGIKEEGGEEEEEEGNAKARAIALSPTTSVNPAAAVETRPTSVEGRSKRGRGERET